ncbi:unnamed protein product [Alopecurus aequalis]
MSASSSSRRRRGGHGGRRGRNSPAPVVAEEETRDWAELPLDAILAILHKLGHVDILMGAGQVSRSWRAAARDEPELWRRIDMLGHAELSHELNLHGMAREAVRRSAGRCEAFWGECAGDDDFLLYLGDQAPSLKSLRLISCNDVSDEGFTEAIQKFSLLEELELSLCPYVGQSGVFGVVGQACPQLKRFTLSRSVFYYLHTRGYDVDEEAQGIATMHELRSLQLSGNRVTNEGLAAILDNCRHLESLDIRRCFNVNMDDTLLAKCARITSLRLAPNELGSEDYDDYCDSRYIDGVYEDAPMNLAKSRCGICSLVSERREYWFALGKRLRPV